MMVSCQPKKSDSTEMSVAEAAKIDNIEDCTVDTVKATAIFWIDKVETKHCKEYGFRTIKAKVLIQCILAIRQKNFWKEILRLSTFIKMKY